MKLAIFIPTCKRPEMLAQLLDDIDRDLPEWWDAWICVGEDKWPDSPEYPEHLKRQVDKWIEFNGHGVKGFAATLSAMWAWLRVIYWDRMLHIPDDVRLAPDFFRRLEETWLRIDDPVKVCLSPLRDARTINWTNWPMLDMGPAMLSMWNDCAIYTDRGWLEALPELPPRIPRIAESSGVGAYISRRFYAEGYRMYHVKETLLYHGEHDSVMHPEHRKRNPIVA